MFSFFSQSQTNPNHLDYFKFVGRVIAKAIYDNKHLECYFTRSFYKHILAKSVKYTDMESEDYAFYKGLEFLIHNKVEDLGYDLTFSTEIREFGVLEVRDLIPNGRQITVTEENKMDYIRLVFDCEQRSFGPRNYYVPGKTGFFFQNNLDILKSSFSSFLRLLFFIQWS